MYATATEKSIILGKPDRQKLLGAKSAGETPTHPRYGISLFIIEQGWVLT
jgi:hypothetical protein